MLGQRARHRGAGDDEDAQRARPRLALLHHADEVGEERRRGLHEGATPRAQRPRGAHRLPHVLQELRRTEHERLPHPVEEPGLVGERRGDEQDVVAPEPQVLDLHRRRAGERVEAVQDALGLAGRPRREQQLGDRVGLRRAGGDRLGVGLLLLGRRREVVPLHAGARQQLDVLAGAGHEHVLDGRGLPRRPAASGSRTGGRARGSARATTNTRAFERRSAWDTSRRPEDRHERAAHGADAQRRDRQHDELAPVRQLVGDRLARLHAEAQQQRRRAGRRPRPARSSSTRASRRRGRRRSPSPSGAREPSGAPTRGSGSRPPGRSRPTRSAARRRRGGARCAPRPPSGSRSPSCRRRTRDRRSGARWGT